MEIWPIRSLQIYIHICLQASKAIVAALYFRAAKQKQPNVSYSSYAYTERRRKQRQRTGAYTVFTIIICVFFSIGVLGIVPVLAIALLTFLSSSPVESVCCRVTNAVVCFLELELFKGRFLFLKRD